MSGNAILGKLKRKLQGGIFRGIVLGGTRQDHWNVSNLSARMSAGMNKSALAKNLGSALFTLRP